MAVKIQKNKSALQTVEEEKNELAIKLLSLKDRSVVHAFKLLFEELTSPATRISKARYNKEIDEAVKRVRGGKSISNDDVMSEMEKW